MSKATPDLINDRLGADETAESLDRVQRLSPAPGKRVRQLTREAAEI